MAQELINVGAANEKQGDTPFVFCPKINRNFTEVYDSLGQNNTVYLRTESDLPNQTATTWVMNPNVPYKLADSFSTSLQTIPAAGASLRGDNLSSYTLSFTGSGSMFKGTDVDFYINNITVDPGIANTGFEFNDTAGGVRRFISENLQVLNCAVWGKFTDMLLAQVLNCSGENAAQGVQFFGTSGVIWSIDRFALTSSSATFKAIDMGTATAPVIELDDLFVTAPAGAFGLSGLANSGNVPVGRLGRVSGCEFLGGMDDLENLSVDDDTRWIFQGNNPTADTFPDALTSFSGNATETIIAASSTDGSNAVLIAGTWVGVNASLFSTTAAGRVTYLAERSQKGPIDISLGLISSGGGAITVKFYLFKNGVVIPASGLDAAISGSVAANISQHWQLQFDQNDYIEIFIENQTNNTNIIADHAVLRVL